MIKRALIVLPGVLALISIFAYGAFDYQWWVPVEFGSSREFILWMSHVWMIAGSWIGIMLSEGL